MFSCPSCLLHFGWKVVGKACTLLCSCCRPLLFSLSDFCHLGLSKACSFSCFNFPSSRFRCYLSCDVRTKDLKVSLPSSLFLGPQVSLSAHLGFVTLWFRSYLLHYGYADT